MASAARQFEPYITPEEHEQIELASGIKHEWYDGEVFAMAGAAPVHNRIAGNAYASLDRQLEGHPCEPWGSDQQVKIPSRRSVVYPDISISCPPAEYDERHRFALTNPKVIIEVLSPSTEKHDRENKFDLYKQISSLRDYVLIASEYRRIEHYALREDGAWTHAVARLDGECVSLASVGCRLCLDDVYRRLALPRSDEAFEALMEAEEDEAAST